MPGQNIQTDVIVLLKRPPSDAFQSLVAFSAEHGLLNLMQRLPGRKSTAVLLDLFDEASVIAESPNQRQTWFLKEARLIRRHEAIGRSYEALRHACALAQLVARNPVHDETRDKVADLLRSACAAFGTGRPPHLVYFKALYRFARDEGYPVSQQWIAELGKRDRTAAEALLSQPTDAPASPAEVARVCRSLEQYLRGHTDVLMD